MNAGEVDVAVVGGGAAGLGAALTLAQAFRRVVVIDDGDPANAASPGIRGYPGHDGVDPRRYLDQVRYEVTRAGGRVVSGRVRALTGRSPEFLVHTEERITWRARRVVLATGAHHRLPGVPGLAGLWGTLVQNCPYCHDWGGGRARSVAVLGATAGAVRLAGLLTQWSVEVVLLPGDARPVRSLPGVRVVHGAVRAVERAVPGVRVLLEPDNRLEVDACFLDAPPEPQLGLLEPLRPDLRGEPLRPDPTGRTPVDGVWVVGTAAGPTQKVITAAGHGVAAGQAINAALVEEDLAARRAEERTA